MDLPLLTTYQHLSQLLIEIKMRGPWPNYKEMPMPCFNADTGKGGGIEEEHHMGLSLFSSHLWRLVVACPWKDCIHIRTSPLAAKSCRFKPFLGANGLSFSRHTCYDTGLRFLWSQAHDEYYVGFKISKENAD